MLLISSSRTKLCLALTLALVGIGVLGCTVQPTSTINPPEVQVTATPAAVNTPAVTLAKPDIPDPTMDHVPGLPSANLGEREMADALLTASGVAVGFAPAPDRDLYQLASELALPPDAPKIPRVVNAAPVSYQVGNEESFWLVDFRNTSVYQADFELKAVSPRAYWYVEKGQNIDAADLEPSIAEFENNIYPKVTEFFGQECTPGVDNDPHLNIIHSELRGVAGYFSSADEHPQEVYEYSNQRETIYINTRALRVGSQVYHEVLAHELQHASHWNKDPSEETWINEGLSELAVSVAGYSAESTTNYLSTPTISLLHWPLDHRNVGAHYGGASLFMAYLAEHYNPDGNFRQLVNQPADGIEGMDAYLKQVGYDLTFRDVFKDWIVANLLDEEEGPYGYRDRQVSADVAKSISEFSELKSAVPQYAPKYIKLNTFSGPIRVKFQGATENSLLPVEVDGPGCWWSNSGDSISSTLTRTVDLRGLSEAELKYQVWFSVEEDWDYGYVEVSDNQGRNWKVLETPQSSSENPIGNGFGPGYTGGGPDWVDESVDLSAYAGREIKLRFHYVTDDAVNGTGLCFRQIRVSGGPVLDGADGWHAQGFLLINNRVKQDYSVQVVQMGAENQVSEMPLDSSNAGEMIISAPQDLVRVVVIIAAMAPQTLQPAPYTLIVEPGDN